MGTLLAFVTVLLTLHAMTEARGFTPCSLHEQTADRRLRFKEPREDPVLIGFEERFHKITCEVANYCSITWTKDGWPVNESSTVQVVNKHQWLTFKQLSLKDSGMYACEASNGRETIRQDISLNIISPDCGLDLEPINMQHSGCQNLSAQLGGSMTFDCRFYVGLQRDSSSDWYKVNESAAPEDFANRYIDLHKPLGSVVFSMSDYWTGEPPENGEQCNCGDCPPVFGTILSAENITTEVFGTYLIYIESSGRPASHFLELSLALPTEAPVIKPFDWHRILTIPLVSLAGVSLVLLLGWLRFRVDIKLKMKDLVGKKDGSKATDVYVSYDWNSDTDRAFAMRLAQFLKKLGYKVCIEIDFLPGGETDSDVLECLKTSHCCIIIFSPSYLSSRRNLDVDFAMDNARRYKREIIPVIYRDISVEGAEQGALVRQILSLPCLRYDRLRSSPATTSSRPPPSRLMKVARSILPQSHSEKSLDKELLLRLPPRDRRAKKPSALLSMASDQSLDPQPTPPVQARTENPSIYPPIEDLSRKLDSHISDGNLAVIHSTPRTVFVPTRRLYPDICRLQSPAVSTYM